MKNRATFLEFSTKRNVSIQCGHKVSNGTNKKCNKNHAMLCYNLVLLKMIVNIVLEGRQPLASLLCTRLLPFSLPKKG